MELTNELKQYLAGVLDKLDEDFQGGSQNEYEAGCTSGHESLSNSLRETLLLEKCFMCNTFLDADHHTFCPECRDQHEQNLRLSRY